MNFRLFIFLIIFESLFAFLGVFGLIFFTFFYFGSGAGANSKEAIMAQNIWLAIWALLPLLFGVYKYRNTTKKEKANSYLYSGLIVTIVSGIYYVMLI